ncbi:MBL fold metallo-hydrolase [Clostridium sp. SHJSY1]|uniref:MBL fold metallo-hydrolase n=1 Tax=Clostridium sp. SHJSY1 TaxID=2942483 RepID=UPI00287566F9|nr:MBL fold metallo-hydrolase [Clostridium sp. SHJSY1]MDS0527973.1 MBL fold metallo-hydrolase [Clostridium sp. SHJSY1]
MNFFKNIVFLSQLTINNIREYFIPREKVFSEPILTDSINWYGHATTIINLSDTLILTDPVLSNKLGFFKRVVEKPFKLEDMKFDYILLSHGHMDHTDLPSLRKLNKSATIIVPKGYKRIMKLLGFKNIVVLRHNEVYEDDKIKITSLKAEHDGRRYYIGIDDESNSYIIEKNQKKVFFAGDTAYTENFKNLQCDVALMPVGCYKPDRFAYMHCTPEESYRMFKMMNCKVMIPIHYKTFKISLENFNDTYNTLNDFNDISLKLLNIGQTYKL